MAQSMYEIRVAGTVPEEDLRDMGAVRVAQDQVNTVLYGVADQTALYGLLERLRALGLDVVEVRRVPDLSLGVDEAPEPERGDRA
ncbi:MAG TPA: hypothetical protein VIB11_07200 [Pedococcus sp.]|jgi:hypothetical protein|uniref:hypothetical protein n=1 Tax=Pedococcus sp. TaxID=2860345 RepID=UPI002F91EBE6